jgi:hypothetical protein
VWLPLRVSLRKELGELLVGMGLVGAALTLFEQLELWDSLIACYQLLDKKVQVGLEKVAGMAVRQLGLGRVEASSVS